MEPEFINYIEHDNVMLERQPLDKATYEKEFYAYKHEGFWQCMDTRDHHLLETLWNENNAPWKNNYENRSIQYKFLLGTTKEIRNINF